MFRVIGILVSLMLSLAFAEVVVDLRAINNAIERESVAISDVFSDIQQFGTGETREFQTLLIDYTQAVIDDDWPALANDRLGQRAESLRKQLSKRVMDLEPATPIQEKLLSRILADIETISDFRLIRLEHSLAKPPVYINVIIFGFLITMACFGTYKPHIPLMVLVSLYSIFVGLVLFLILTLSDPFQGGGVDTITYERLLEWMRSHNR
jgi:hypothetical protein